LNFIKIFYFFRTNGDFSPEMSSGKPAERVIADNAQQKAAAMILV